MCQLLNKEYIQYPVNTTNNSVNLPSDALGKDKYYISNLFIYYKLQIKTITFWDLCTQALF